MAFKMRTWLRGGWGTLTGASFVVVGALLWSVAAFAQVGVTYGKVEQPWYMQGKISGGISVTSSSVATKLPVAGLDASICNTGSADANLAFGADNTVAATTAGSTLLKAGACTAYDLFPPTGISARLNYVAAISASSTTLTVETGIGNGATAIVASGGGGSGTSSAFSAGFPANGTAIGVKNGTNMVPLTADSSSNLNVNCAVGCSGGTVSNASSAVATSSTNNGAVSWLYGFNGTTWDQLQVDASKSLKINIASGNITGFATSALQTTGNSSLSSIDGKTPGLGQALAAASVPVVLTAAQIITLTPPAAIVGFALDTSVGTTNTDLGAPGSSACATDSGTCNINALLQRNNQRLSTINSTLNSPFQANGVIGNTSFGISGTLPAFAAIPAVKIDQTTPGTTNLVSIGSNGTVNPATANSWGVGTFASVMPTVGQATGLFDGTNLVRARGDETNGIWVNIKAGAGSGGTALADEAAFAQGTTQGTPVFGLYTTSVTNLTSGQTGIIRSTNDRQLMVSDASVVAAIGTLNTTAGNPLATQTAANIIGGVGVPSWAGGTLGAMANYGTSPGAVLVPGVNAFVTNAVTVAQATAASLNATVVGTGTFAVQATLNASPSLINGNGVVPTQGGTVLTATNGGYQNLLQGNAVLSATNGLYSNQLQGNAALSATNGSYANLLQGNAVLSATNPIFGRLTDGTNASTVKAASTPSAATDTAFVVDQRPGTTVQSSPGTLANGATLVKGTVSAAMTGTSATQVVALVSSKVLYITRASCKGDPANAVGTKVQLTDGSGGAVLDTLTVDANGGGEQATGATPLFWTTSGNGLYAQNVTTGASVICTASGYSG